MSAPEAAGPIPAHAPPAGAHAPPAGAHAPPAGAHASPAGAPRLAAGAPRTVSVTGATGYLGRHVMEALRLAGHGARPLLRPFDSAEALGPGSAGHDAPRVIHLAFPPASERGVGVDAMRAYVQASSQALARVMRGTRGQLVLCSSAAVYAPADHALNEDAAIAPPGPYGEAKREQELLLGEAAAVAGWDYTIARVFNVLGPGQPRGLLAADLWALLSAAPAGPIACGPLDTARDYVDVREVARRLCVLPPGCFNICRGEAVSGRDLAEALCQRLGIAPSRLVPRVQSGGVGLSLGDPQRLAALGLALQTGWRQSLDEQLDAATR